MCKRLSLILLCLFFTLHAFATKWVLPAETIDTADASFTIANIAIDQDGNSYAVWIGDVNTIPQLYYSNLPFEGTWSTPIPLSFDPVIVDLSSLNSYQPQIVAARGGGVVVAWVAGTLSAQMVQTRTFNGQTWSPIETVTIASSGVNPQPQLSIFNADPATIELIWVENDGTSYRIYNSEKTIPPPPSVDNWTTPVVIQGPTTDTLDQLQLACDLSGVGIAVWIRIGMTGNYSIEAAERFLFEPNNWSTPLSITSSSNILNNPQVAINQGRAVTIWTENNFPTILSTSFFNYTMPGWSTPVSLVTSAQGVAFPQVGIDSAGYAVAIWNYSPTGLDFGVEAATYNPYTATWTGPTVLDSALSQIPNVQFGLDGTGNAIAVWSHYGFPVNGIVYSKSYTFSTSLWGVLTELNFPPSLPNSGMVPQIAVNTNGLAAAIWTNNPTRMTSSIQAAVTEMPLSPCVTCPNPISPSTPVTMWFVNNSNPVAGNGGYDHPYNNLHTALDASHACDVIYVFPGSEPYDAIASPFFLLNNQRLLGTTLEAFQRCPEAGACNLPLLTNNPAAMAVIATSDNNQVSGFNIQPAPSREPIAGISCTDSQNFLCTDNIFTIYASLPVPVALNIGSTGIRIQSADVRPTGDYTITNCIFQAANNTTLLPGDLVTSEGIIIDGTNNGLFKIDSNLFTYLDASSGLARNVELLEVQGSKVLITNNSMFNQFAPQNITPTAFQPTVLPIQVTGTGVFDFPRTPLSVTIENNEITFALSPLVTQGTGIGVNIASNEIFSVCAKVHNNSVVFPPEIPLPSQIGYLFDNTSVNPFVLDFDSSNRGNLGIQQTLNNTFAPIFLTSECP